VVIEKWELAWKALGSTTEVAKKALGLGATGDAELEETNRPFLSYWAWWPWELL
jgi:hypothetical protein